MMRLINIVLITAMLVTAGVVFVIKDEADRASNRRDRLYRQVAQERETIAILNAEWSQLNQPRRLQEFSERYQSYLELDRINPDQIAVIDDIPLRSASTSDASLAIARIIANTKTGELTGSTPRKAVEKPKTAAPLRTLETRPGDPLLKIIPKPEAH